MYTIIACDRSVVCSIRGNSTLKLCIEPKKKLSKALPAAPEMHYNSIHKIRGAN